MSYGFILGMLIASVGGGFAFAKAEVEILGWVTFGLFCIALGCMLIGCSLVSVL